MTGAMNSQAWSAITENERDAHVAQHVYGQTVRLEGKRFYLGSSGTASVPKYTSTAQGLLGLIAHMRKRGYTDGKFVLREKRFVWIWAGEGKPNLQAGHNYLIDAAHLAALKEEDHAA
mgnify:CR=1 FL=1